MAPKTQTSGKHRDDGPVSKVAVDVVDHPEKHHMLPVWFFIGVILAIYGILIFATGIFEYNNPPDTILANLHAPIWWGVLLAIVGAIFVRKHYPRQR